MTRDDAKKILMAIQAAYPNFKVPDKTITINTWYSVLNEYEYEIVSAALNVYIRSDTSGFSPSPGQIIDKIQFLFPQGEEINETEAWYRILKAMRNSGYHAEEEFNKLPPILQKTVASPRQLREWAIMEDIDGRAMTVLQSQIMRAYREEREKEKELNKLSPELRNLIEGNVAKVITQAEDKQLTISEEREIAEKRWSPPTGKIEDKIKEVKNHLRGN